MLAMLLQIIYFCQGAQVVISVYVPSLCSEVTMGCAMHALFLS